MLKIKYIKFVIPYSLYMLSSLIDLSIRCVYSHSPSTKKKKNYIFRPIIHRVTLRTQCVVMYKIVAISVRARNLAVTQFI